MELKHIPEVLKVERASFVTPWSAHAFTYELLHNELSYYTVALVDGQVVGYAGMWMILDEAHVTNIAVAPEYRHRKIGYRLMCHLINKARSEGINRMTLEVRPSNIYARRLYKSLGFEERGMRKNYYTDTNEDAIIMWNPNLQANLGHKRTSEVKR